MKDDTQLEAVLKWIKKTFINKYRYLLLPVYYGVSLHRRVPLNVYTLRRNIHRLEKGLIHKKKKPVYAQDYILETIFAYHYCKSNGLMDAETKKWVEAVLAAYFSIVEKRAPMISDAWTYYCGLSPENKAPDNLPYSITKRPELSITYDQFKDLCLRRRSVRHYQDRKVEPEIVKKAMEAAAQAPSACNRQAFQYLFYNEADMVKRLVEIPGGIANYTLPSVIVMVADYSAYADERDIKNPIIDISLAAMTFQFALETLGLSSVFINWSCLAPFDEKLRTIISLKPYESVVAMMGVGYPDGEAVIPFSAKKTADMLLKVNDRIL